ncbi:MAG: hypothetical protein IJZ04_09475 [Clostridia bacterium]|nr:hypothetical protein [Clostridia bacterium]MBQ8739704.1 hypothetical protein [Clostridia bacterium]
MYGSVWHGLARAGQNGKYDLQRLQKMGSFEIILRKFFKHTCDKKAVRKEWIESLAVQKAFEIVNDEKIVDYLVDKLFEMQGVANPRLPQLKAQMADVLKKIENIIQAIEQGIIFDSTRDRLAELEKQKSELEISILEEQIERPLLTREQIRFGIERFRKLNIEKEEDKKCLIDNFINAIYLYDDKITFTFNYKDGTKTVLLSECDFTPVGSDTYCFGPKGSLKLRSDLRGWVISFHYPLQKEASLMRRPF